MESMCGCGSCRFRCLSCAVNDGRLRNLQIIVYTVDISRSYMVIKLSKTGLPSASMVVTTTSTLHSPEKGQVAVLRVTRNLERQVGRINPQLQSLDR